MQDNMFTQSEKAQLQAVFEKLVHPIELIFHQSQESEFSRKLQNCVEELRRLSNRKVRISKGDTENAEPIIPCFKIGIPKDTCIIYAALPVGHQFKPFKKFLDLALNKDSLTDDDEYAPKKSPVELQVLISEHCPHCPAVVETALLSTSRSAPASLWIIDSGQFPDLTRKYGIKSVPATVLDGRLVLIGSVSTDRLMDLMKIRGTIDFEMEAVRSLIEIGRIPEAAASLAEEAGQKIILSFLQELDFSKRLSALVVVERALEDEIAGVRTLIPSLVALLSHSDPRIRGDIADLLGKMGDPKVIANLEPLTTDSDPDVAEAAADAIAELRR